MGDVLICGPAVRAIAARAEVTMLVSSQGLQAAALLPGVTHVLEWDCPWITSPAPTVNDARPNELIDALRAGNYDSCVILTSFHQSPLPLALLCRMAGIPHIAGLSTDHAGSLLDVRLRPGDDVPEHIPEPERALALCAAAGYSLPSHDDGSLRIKQLPTLPLPLSRPYVVVHPGASAPARMWQEEHASALVRELVSHGWGAIVTGSPAEKELTARVSGSSGLDLGGALSLEELAHVIANATAIVVGNTGPMHLAAAVGTPTVALFSPVVPASQWAPYRVPHVLLGRQESPCAGTRWTQCALEGHPCLGEVTAAQALAAVEELVEGER